MPLARKKLFLTALIAGLVCLAVFGRTLTCGFVNYEDPEYVLLNPFIRSFDRNFWYSAFATVPLNFWVPLLWISFALDYQVWGVNPLGYHLTNSVLHAVNTGMVVCIADRIYRQSVIRIDTASRPAYFYPALLLVAGLLFGIHPARVESVAWITQRKDVLNGLFTMASVFFYLRFREKRDGGAPRPALLREYLASLALFLLSLTAKPSSVFIPIALLVMDWYPLGRFRDNGFWRLAVEKLPYLVLAVPIIAASVIGRAVQGGYNSLADIPFAVRTAAAGNSILEYFRLMLLPVGILPYYHLPRPVPTFYIFTAAATFLSLCLLLWFGRKRVPWLVAIVFFFVVTIFPGLHFFADGYQVILVPHYTYLASLLPAIIIAALIFNGRDALEARQKGAGTLLLGAVGVLLACYAATTVRLIGDWKDSGAMWEKVITHKPFEKAYFFRGEYRAGKGDYLSAVDDYTTCITLSAGLVGPKMYNVYAFRGYALMQAGYYEDALEDFTTAISQFPHPLYYYYRGTILQALGRNLDAEDDLRRAGTASGPLYWME